MLTGDEAEQIAYRFINRPNASWQDMPEMIVTRREERDFGWIFYWTSRPFHETGDFQHALAGNGPVLVSKSGEVSQAGTAGPVEERIREAEARFSHNER